MRRSEELVAKLKLNIQKALEKEDEKNFYKNLSLLVEGKEFPEHAYRWVLEDARRAREEDKIFVLLAARNHLKSVTMTQYRPLFKSLIRPMHETLIFSYSEKQAKKHLSKIQRICDMYFPEVKSELWSSTRLGFSNGSLIEVGSLSSTLYGYHPHYIVVDDPLGGEGDPQKIIKSNLPPGFIEERFFSMIMPMRAPDTELVVVGIPFYHGDMYSKFKERPDSYYVAEYPAIIDWERKKVLWEEERPFWWLLKQKDAIGNLRFNREYQLKPFDSKSSLFPYEQLLSRAIALGKDLTFTHQRIWDDSIIVIGADFSNTVEGEVTSQTSYIVFIVLEYKDGIIYIRYIYRNRGLEFDEQLDLLASLYYKYNADLVAVEAVNFQSIYPQELNNRLFNVYAHKTGSEKNTYTVGIPSLRVLFERNKIICPAGDEESRDLSKTFLQELEGFVPVEGKILHIGKFNDIAMAFYIAIQGLRTIVPNLGMEEVEGAEIKVREYNEFERYQKRDSFWRNL